MRSLSRTGCSTSLESQLVQHRVGDTASLRERVCFNRGSAEVSGQVLHLVGGGSGAVPTPRGGSKPELSAQWSCPTKAAPSWPAVEEDPCQLRPVLFPIQMTAALSPWD